MSVFQRRLASSTYALLRSFERRLDQLDDLIDAIRTGRLTAEELLHASGGSTRPTTCSREDRRRGDARRTAGRRTRSPRTRLLGGVVAVSLAELQAERQQVQQLLELARQVRRRATSRSSTGSARCCATPAYADEKMLIFTEHRDTLEFLVRRLEGIGFAGQVAQIHGGMDYREREEQVEFFRRPLAEGGARLPGLPPTRRARASTCSSAG